MRLKSCWAFETVLVMGDADGLVFGIIVFRFVQSHYHYYVEQKRFPSAFVFVLVFEMTVLVDV